MPTSALAATPAAAGAFWDTVGKAYQTAFKDVPAQQRSLEWLLATLPQSSSVADIGCGTGRPICEAMVKAGYAVTGIDVSPVMLQTAREQVPEAKFIQSSAFDWNPPAEGFNAVTAYFSLIGHITQDQIRSFFPLAYSWLKRGGLLVFGTEPVDGELVESKWMGRTAVASGLSPEEFVEVVKTAGFEVVKVEREKFLPRAEEAGLCDAKENREESHLFIWAKKPE